MIISHTYICLLWRFVEDCNIYFKFIHQMLRFKKSKKKKKIHCRRSLCVATTLERFNRVCHAYLRLAMLLSNRCWVKKKGIGRLMRTTSIYQTTWECKRWMMATRMAYRARSRGHTQCSRALPDGIDNLRCSSNINLKSRIMRNAAGAGRTHVYCQW